METEWDPSVIRDCPAPKDTGEDGRRREQAGRGDEKICHEHPNMSRTSSVVLSSGDTC